jgi:hypothetical protein
MPLSTPFQVQMLLQPVVVPIVEIEARSQAKETVVTDTLSAFAPPQPLLNTIEAR